MEKSGFFNAMKVGDTWDRVYKADNFAGYFATFIGNGVFPNPAKQLQVLETDRMNVIIKPGKAWINGFIYINTDELILPIDVADGVLHRIDKIILRYDVVEREIRVKIKKGEFASEPKAPQLTRNADMYELALADIKVNAGAISITQSDITDLRLNKELCGIVHGVVDQVDTTAIFNQFESWYSQTKEAYDKDIAAWTKEKKQSFDNWYFENATAFMQRFNKWYENNTKQWEKDFTTWFKNTEGWEKDFDNWFATIKNALDGDIAAKLTAKTIELEDSIKEVKEQFSEKFKTIDKGDFNLVKKVGIYAMNNAQYNTPNSNQHFYSLIVMKSGLGSNYIQQVAIEENTTNMYIRYLNDAIWSEWDKIALTSCVNEQLADITKQANKIEDIKNKKIYKWIVDSGVLYLEEVAE